MPSTAARRLSLNGQSVKLSSREFDLALYLFRNVGRLVSRATLEKAIWGRELGVDSKTVDTHIYRLRVKLRLQPENGLQLASVCAGFSPDPGGDAVLSKPRPVLDRAVRDRMNPTMMRATAEIFVIFEEPDARTRQAFLLNSLGLPFQDVDVGPAPLAASGAWGAGSRT